MDDETVLSFVLRMSSAMAGCHHPRTILRARVFASSKGSNGNVIFDESSGYLN